MPRLFNSAPRRGITLIELLVAMTIIGILISLLLPAVQAARQAASRVSCKNNLHQLAIAALNFDEARGKFPSGGHFSVVVGGRPTGGTNLFVELLPYIDQANLYEKWDLVDNSNNVAGGRDAIQAQVITLLLCPSDPLPETVVENRAAVSPTWSWGFYGIGSYGGNAGTLSLPNNMSRDGIFWIDSSVGSKDIRDGASNTFLFGERYHLDPEYEVLHPVVNPPLAQHGKWGFVAGAGIMANVTLSTPELINYRVPPDGDVSTALRRTCTFGSAHTGGANFAFADGHVRFVSENISLQILQRLSTRRNGEVVGEY